ncbi:MAG: riboflavin synthase [PVC group bacterium]
MFTGIIQELGTVIRRGDGSLTIDAGRLSRECRPGDSIAVSGVCLTVVRADPPQLTMDLLLETRERSNLGVLQPGDAVNLEPVLKASGSLGGHFVTGHIDGQGELVFGRNAGRDRVLKVALPSGLEKYVVEKGSIALEGVSLTVADIAGNTVSVHVIPYTLSHTNLGGKTAGARLNVETDLLGKYVIRYLEKKDVQSRSIDKAFLEETGFI